jgi:hypothetical protein
MAFIHPILLENLLWYRYQPPPGGWLPIDVFLVKMPKTGTIGFEIHNFYPNIASNKSI